MCTRSSCALSSSLSRRRQSCPEGTQLLQVTQQHRSIYCNPSRRPPLITPLGFHCGGLLLRHRQRRLHPPRCTIHAAGGTHWQMALRRGWCPRPCRVETEPELITQLRIRITFQSRGCRLSARRKKRGALLLTLRLRRLLHCQRGLSAFSRSPAAFPLPRV